MIYACRCTAYGDICYVYSNLMKSRMWHVTMIEPRLSKDWNNYWRLIRSVSIGKIDEDGIFSMVLTFDSSFMKCEELFCDSFRTLDLQGSSEAPSTCWTRAISIAAVPVAITCGCGAVAWGSQVRMTHLSSFRLPRPGLRRTTVTHTPWPRSRTDRRRTGHQRDIR